MSVSELRPHVLSTIKTIRSARKLRRDLTVVGHTPLSTVFFGGGLHSLAEILRGNEHRDEWRFLQSLDQLSPWDAYNYPLRPGDFEEVTFDGSACIGMLWAKLNQSMIVSFGFTPNWTASQISAQFNQLDQDCGIRTSPVEIPNLAVLNHVDIHRTLITEYGQDISNSSLIHEGNGFVVRMYLNDHNPPHFHVMMRRDTSDTAARYAIRTLDCLTGNLSPPIRERVESWAAQRQEQLLSNWDRCRNSQKPFYIED